MPEDFTKLDNSGRAFRWSTATEKAAQDVAEDELTDQEIADKAGVSRQALWAWKQHPEFAVKVDKIQTDIRAAIRKHGIAVVENRVRALDRRWRKMHKVIEKRAVSAEMQNVPGGDTGLLVHNVKGVGKGDDFQLIDLYEVDTGLLKELREHEKQAAQELGQWSEKTITQDESATLNEQDEEAIRLAYGRPSPIPDGESSV